MAFGVLQFFSFFFFWKVQSLYTIWMDTSLSNRITNHITISNVRVRVRVYEI